MLNEFWKFIESNLIWKWNNIELQVSLICFYVNIQPNPFGCLEFYLTRASYHTIFHHIFNLNLFPKIVKLHRRFISLLLGSFKYYSRKKLREISLIWTKGVNKQNLFMIARVRSNELQKLYNIFQHINFDFISQNKTTGTRK